MIKFIRFKETDWGRGFITHDDWITLKFSVLKSIATVNGESTDIDKWINRIKGIEITQAAALKDLLTWEKESLQSEKTKMLLDINQIDTRIGEIIIP